MKRRPEFIPRAVFRAYLSRTQLDKYLSVDGIKASSYVERQRLRGRPLPCIWKNGGYLWRLLDIVARAWAQNEDVSPPYKAVLAQDVAELRSEKAQLMAEIETLKAQCRAELEFRALERKLGQACKQLTGYTLLREEEILAGRMEMPMPSGVYFLFRGQRIVYVGQSKILFARIVDPNHPTAKEGIDGFAYLPCPPKALNVLESLYIHALRPELNGAFQTKSGVLMAAPIRLDRLPAMIP